MNELKLNNDHELKFSVTLLRDIIASEQRRVKKMIDDYTPEMVKKPVNERFEELEGWFYFIWPDDFMGVKVNENTVKLALRMDHDVEDPTKEMEKLFPDCEVVFDTTETDESWTGVVSEIYMYSIYAPLN